MPERESLPGIIIRAQSGFFTVLTSEGEVVAQLRGRLKRPRRTTDIAALGDRVQLARLEDGSGVIESIDERQRVLSRRAVLPWKGSQRDIEQVLVANPDQAVFVFSCADPDPNFRMLDRFLVVAESHKEVSLLHKHRTAAGDMRYIELVAAPLFEANGALGGIIEAGRDVTERRLREEKLVYLAHNDPLTDLPNRIAFFERLRQAIATAMQEEKMFGVLYIDLDGFKAVNDTFGHKVGDMLLKNVAKRLNACLRHDDMVARMGGDEFAIILAPFKERQDGLGVSQKIQDRLGEVFRLGEHRCVIGASVGISYYPDDGGTPEELLKQADDAMYHNKRIRKEMATRDQL